MLYGKTWDYLQMDCDVQADSMLLFQIIKSYYYINMQGEQELTCPIVLNPQSVVVVFFAQGTNSMYLHKYT